MSSEQPPEYVALSIKLIEWEGAGGANAMLAMLDRGYNDSDQRLDALKLTLRQIAKARGIQDVEETLKQAAQAPQPAPVFEAPESPPPAPALVDRSPRSAGVGVGVTEQPAKDAASARARRLWRRGAVRAKWDKRKRGQFNRDVKGEFPVQYPRYVNAAVRAAMSKSVLLAYLACAEEADLDGQLEMPAGQLGGRIGCNRRNAQKALDALLGAGLLRLVHGGGPRTPNVYGLAPSREFDSAAEARAITALTDHRQTAAADIMSRAKASRA